MGKPWEADDDFLMYLTSGDQGTHPLEPGVTTGSLCVEPKPGRTRKDPYFRGFSYFNNAK